MKNLDKRRKSDRERQKRQRLRDCDKGIKHGKTLILEDHISYKMTKGELETNLEKLGFEKSELEIVYHVAFKYIELIAADGLKKAISGKSLLKEKFDKLVDFESLKSNMDIF
jgi:hypothetical protein